MGKLASVGNAFCLKLSVLCNWKLEKQLSGAEDCAFSSKKSSHRIRKMAPSFPAPSYYPDQKVSISDSHTEIDLVAIIAILDDFGDLVSFPPNFRAERRIGVQNGCDIRKLYKKCNKI